jgi:hypothetical protein
MESKSTYMESEAARGALGTQRWGVWRLVGLVSTWVTHWDQANAGQQAGLLQVLPQGQVCRMALPSFLRKYPFLEEAVNLC